MIKLKYDVPTAGIRVSFILRDGQSASLNFNGLFDSHRIDSSKDEFLAKQNVETLSILRAMIDQIIEDTP